MLIRIKSKTFVGLLSLVFLFFLGCRPTHNQTVMPKEWESYFNATPVNKNYIQTNSQHKVLVAIIDSGTDYNHPFLKDHVHYELDKQGNAIGAGWDFVGNDAWPLPYLARTRHLYTKDKSALSEETLNLNNLTQLLKLEPDLRRWLHPHRHHDDESDQRIYHGTHVAGLASYDDSRIGIVPYRILPDQESLDNKAHDMIDTFYEALEKAIVKAHGAGVKVVNMSLGTSFGETDNGAQHMIEVFKKFEKLVNSYPDMVFVAAAGNEKTWVNGETRYSFPCGIKATNIVCVASVNKSGSPSEFTNIPLVQSPLVFAPGEKILAPVPSQYCNSKQLGLISGSLDPSDLDRLSKKILKECSTNTVAPIMPLSGTSMASPIIARVIAQEALTLNSNANAEEIINRFISHSQKAQIGPLTVSKFRLPLPTWYPKDSDTQGLGLLESSMSRGYFEFYIKR